MEIITNSTYEVQASLSFEFYSSKHRVIASSAIYMMRYKEDNKIDVHSTYYINVIYKKKERLQQKIKEYK